MSATYTSIIWNKNKKRYDLGIAIFVILFLVLFFVLHSMLQPSATFETVFIRAFGWLALLMLQTILVIGPLARINSRFNIVLYNRRHFGVSMFIIGAIHGVFNILNFHSLSDTNPIKSVFLSNLRYGSIEFFPFQVLGFIALIILGLMATSSHDFWLKNLGIKTWKALHMMVYLAYALLLLHVTLGGLQNEASPIIFTMVMVSFISVAGLHLYTGLKENNTDKFQSKSNGEFIYVCNLDEIEENKAKIISLADEKVAIFKYNKKLSAVNNVCRHQGGPLGEGRIVDGCITCPWHGYQYLPENGQSPPPFNEKVETYLLKIDGNDVFINPKALPPGTPVEPAEF